MTEAVSPLGGQKELAGKASVLYRPIITFTCDTCTQGLRCRYRPRVSVGDIYLQARSHFRAVLADKAIVHMHQVPAASTLRTYSRLLGDCDPGMVSTTERD